MINTTTAIMPHRFMPPAKLKSTNELLSFYEIPESQLYRMAELHYGGDRSIQSGFTSWAASLHLVLCYAKHMNPKDEPHVAVMDTHELEDKVYVWHVPHLIGGGNHEYLAHGCIRGNGYRAASLRKMEQSGLLTLFFEAKDPSRSIDAFGFSLRLSMFRKGNRAVDDGECFLIWSIASLFGNLYLPIATALLSLRPRDWRNWPATGQGVSTEDRVAAIDTIIRLLRIESVPQDLHQEAWLQTGMVDTSNFPDVQQWIHLLAMIAERLQARPQQSEDDHPEEPNSNAPKRKRDHTEEPMEEKPDAKRPRMELRSRKPVRYRVCRDGSCGTCVSCNAATRRLP
tara:strand:- start:2455 stop:3477 length:1023 start_codon:yes stop_codon:yes gene_type:complete